MVFNAQVKSTLYLENDILFWRFIKKYVRQFVEEMQAVIKVFIL